MLFSSLLLVALTGVVAADHGDGDHGDGNNGHNSTEGTSVKAQCKKIAKMTKLTELAANTTKLAEKTDNNATLIAEIQAMAATAATDLTTLTSNATLMAECDIVFAEGAMIKSCKSMSKLEAAAKIIANETLLAEWTENNTTKAENFKAKIAAKQADMTTLASNTTLTSFCAGWNDKMACKAMAKLEKKQAIAANTTLLNEKLDAESAAKFQAKVAEAVTAMNAWLTNATLIETCKSLGLNVATVAATAAASTDGSATGGSAAGTSAGVSTRALAGGQIFALVSAFVYALAML